jgi:hypothetical protein
MGVVLCKGSQMSAGQYTRCRSGASTTSAGVFLKSTDYEKSDEPRIGG